MSTVRPGDIHKAATGAENGLPTSEYSLKLLAQGQVMAKDPSGRLLCLRLRANGNHCGRYLIYQAEGNGDYSDVGHGTSSYSDKGGFSGSGGWICPVKHDKFDPKRVTSSANIKDPRNPEEVVEIKPVGDKINFDFTLEDLESKTLVADILKKLAVAMESVPTPTMGAAKRVMAIQEQILSQIRTGNDNPNKTRVKTPRKRKSQDEAPRGQAESQSPLMTGSQGATASLT